MNGCLTLSQKQQYFANNFVDSINLMRYATWGYLTNGKFNGIIGDMINGVMDVAALPMNIEKAERYSVMDFTAVIWTVK